MQRGLKKYGFLMPLRVQAHSCPFSFRMQTKIGIQLAKTAKEHRNTQIKRITDSAKEAYNESL
jgi:hypothetical protein